MEADNYNRNFMLWGGNFARAQAPNAGYTVENGVLTSATYAGVAGRDYAVYDMIYREATAKSSYITFDADWRINDTFTTTFQAGTTEGTGETARQFIAEVTTNRGGGASWTSHGTSRPLDWAVGGDSSPAGVTSFGTWGNRQITATDKEDWANLDFNKDLDNGAFPVDRLRPAYADHERETASPEGAAPVTSGRPPERRHRCLSERFREQHRWRLAAQLLVFHAGCAEGVDPGQFHLALGQRWPDRPPQLRW